jgi:uncharacterized protein YbjT (DUF2867 family)
MKLFVTGATGFVGGRLVPALLAAGHEVTVLTRDAARYQGPPEVDVIEGDLLDSGGFRLVDGAGTGAGDGEGSEASASPRPTATLGDLLRAQGVEAAYYLVHSMGAGADFETDDRTAARTFTRGVSEAGVKRVVYLGGLGADADSLSPHLRSRREVERVLAEGDPAVTTLRAAIIVGADSASFRLVRQLAKRLPVMITPKWVETLCQPIAIDDVVAYLVGVLDVEETAGETYDIGGPDVLTYREILRRTGRQLGHEPRIVPVPVLTPRLSAYWLDLVTDVPKSVAQPLIEGLRNPVVASETRIRDLVDVDLTPFDVAVTRALGHDSGPVPDLDRRQRATATTGSGSETELTAENGQ